MSHDFNEQMKFMNQRYLKDCSVGELLWFMKECINLIESEHMKLNTKPNTDKKPYDYQKETRPHPSQSDK